MYGEDLIPKTGLSYTRKLSVSLVLFADKLAFSTRVDTEVVLSVVIIMTWQMRVGQLTVYERARETQICIGPHFVIEMNN